MESKQIVETNKKYWNANADLWFGTTALPEYGVNFVTEDELHLFGDVSGKKLLEICCGSGHSLKYQADRHAAELWGVDFSESQLKNAENYLKENGCSATLICGEMESELPIPQNYFDFVYSIYGMGWSTDLPGTFRKVASYLKKDGIFIFSWHHPLNYCVNVAGNWRWDVTKREEVIEDGHFVFAKSYFDESLFAIPVDGSEILLRNRKLSTYINALAEAGFAIERLVEDTDRKTLETEEPESQNAKRAKMIPLSMCIKARKL